MLRGVWQAVNCVSIHATYCVIVTWASLGETKMWAIFSRSWIMSKRINICSNLFTKYTSLFARKAAGSHTILVYRSYTDKKHRAASLRQQSFLLTEISRFNDFQNGGRPPSWVLKICSFHAAFVGMRFCFLTQNFAEIGQSFSMSYGQKSDFQVFFH